MNYCKFREWLGLKPLHKWSRSKQTPGVKTCKRCGLVRSINKRVKAMV